MKSTGADLGKLETEQVNPRTKELDKLDSLNLVKTLHRENFTIAASIDFAVPVISEVVDEICNRFKRGGRLLYIGAGTSGRLGVLDASECPPTFSVDSSLIQGIIAGGEKALTTSVEGAEDSEEEGKKDLEARHLTEADTVIGIASSGRTPYVKGALNYGKSIGAFTVALVNVSDSIIEKEADKVIRAITGPEPITGSTRLKAGTAQKLILNLITNSVMIKMGKVYGNLMIDLKASNSKLMDRAERIVMNATNVERSRAEELLKQSEYSSKVAIVMQLLDVNNQEARDLLDNYDGHIRSVLENKGI